MLTETTSYPLAVLETSTAAPASTARQLPRLMQWLYQAAARRGETKGDVARHLGVTYGYLNQLSTGLRSTRNITSDFCRACARYLEVPTVAVMLAAGRIQLEDFLVPEAGGAQGKQLARGLERIAADPLVGCLMPPETWDAPDRVKALLISLYEQATQQELFPPRSLPQLFQGLQDAALLIAQQDCANEAQFLVSEQPTEMA